MTGARQSDPVLQSSPLVHGRIFTGNQQQFVNLNITLEQPGKKLALFGSSDRYLRMIRDTFGVQLVSRDDELRLSGEKDQVGKAAAVLDKMQKTLRRQDWLSAEDVGRAIGSAAHAEHERSSDEIDVYARGH